MAQAEASADFNRPADEVWAVIADFGGIDRWMPGIDSCRLEGEDRIIGTMGMEITERLIKLDEAGRALTYSVIAGAPVESHRATVSVTPNGDGSRATWVVETTPDEMADVMGGIYQQALDALRTYVES